MGGELVNLFLSLAMVQVGVVHRSGWPALWCSVRRQIVPDGPSHGVTRMQTHELLGTFDFLAITMNWQANHPTLDLVLGRNLSKKKLVEHKISPRVRFKGLVQVRLGSHMATPIRTVP